MASNLPNGLDTVAETPGYSVGIKLGYCSLTASRITSKTTSTPGAKRRSVAVAADTTPRNARLKSQNGVPLGTPKLCNLVWLAPISVRSK